MYLQNSTCYDYLGGQKSFLIIVEVDMLNGQKSSMWCPCVDYKNEKQYSNSLIVHAHLIMRGFMDDYRYWNKHREEGVNARDQAQAAGQQDGEEGLHETNAGSEEAPFGNEELCDDDVADIAANYDAVYLAKNPEETVRDAFGFEEYTGLQFKKMEQLLKDMKMPLYPSSNERYTKLSASLKLLQLKAKKSID